MYPTHLYYSWIIVLNLCCVIIACNSKFEIAHQWNYVNFTWPSTNLMNKLKYDPHDYVPVGIKFYPSHDANQIFIALPRNKPNARIVLATIPINADKTNPLLTPYPSWEMNMGEDCNHLQDLISMEIDTEGIMWVLDAKRTTKYVTCPPKIVLLDLKNNGKVIQSYNVPSDQCPEGCYLNDLVIDGDFLYSSDTTSTDPGIFIYNKILHTSWKARDNATMFGDTNASDFEAQGVKFTGVSHINGIALSPNCPGNRTFYYTPQTSFHIYSIPTWVLQNKEIATGDISSYIKDVVEKPGATGGMICNSKGDIYFGLLPFDSIAVKKRDNGDIEIIEKNSKLIQWPDTFAFSDGYLYVSTTEILKFNTEGIDLEDINFRILKLFTHEKSYYYCAGGYLSKPGDRNLNC